MSKLDDLLNTLESKFPGQVTVGSNLKNISQEKVITGIYELDEKLGGGLSRACSYHFYGESKSGKSATMVQTIAINQALDSEFVAAIINLEGNWGPDYIQFMLDMGVDLDRVIIITEEAVETALDKSLALIRSRKLDLLIIDSAAAIISTKERDKASEDASKTADRASMLEVYARRITALLHPKYDKPSKAHVPNPCCVVFLNQLRTGGIGGYRAFRQPASAKALEFFVRNQISLFSSQTEDVIKYSFVKEMLELIPTNDQTQHFVKQLPIGKTIHYDVEKSRSGHEHAEVAVDFYYKDLRYPAPSGFMGFGFDTLSSAIELGVYLGVIQAKGSWYEIEGLSAIQGKDSLLGVLRTEATIRNTLLDLIEEKVYGRKLLSLRQDSESEESFSEIREEDGQGFEDVPDTGVGVGKRKGRPKRQPVSD